MLAFSVMRSTGPRTRCFARLAQSSHTKQPHRSWSRSTVAMNTEQKIDLPSLLSSKAGAVDICLSLEQQYGISEPTPIQEAVIPRLYDGDTVLMHAETGSGKTVAFLLPLLLRARQVVVGGQEGQIIIISPTRELAVQHASVATTMTGNPEKVYLVVRGSGDKFWESMSKASVIVATPEEMISFYRQRRTDEDYDHIAAFRNRLCSIVLDEIDFLMPHQTCYGAVDRKNVRKGEAKVKSEDFVTAIEVLLEHMIASSPRPDLQLVAASATVSKKTRMRLDRVLRADPLSRWRGHKLEIVRPAAVLEKDLSRQPIAITVPDCIDHYCMSLNYSKLRHIERAQKLQNKKEQRKQEKEKGKGKARHGRPSPPDPQARTLPQIIMLEALFQIMTSSLVQSTEGQAVSGTGAATKKALVLVCHSSGLNVREVCKFLKQRGVDEAVALHEAMGFARNNNVGDLRVASLDSGQPWQQQSPSTNTKPPLLVTFEGMARGLHFEAVDTAIIVGKPSNSSMYLHLAGRVGRMGAAGMGQVAGDVVTLCGSGQAAEMRRHWGTQLGGVVFQDFATAFPQVQAALDRSGTNLEVAEGVSVDADEGDQINSSGSGSSSSSSSGGGSGSGRLNEEEEDSNVSSGSGSTQSSGEELRRRQTEIKKQAAMEMQKSTQEQSEVILQTLGTLREQGILEGAAYDAALEKAMAEMRERVKTEGIVYAQEYSHGDEDTGEDVDEVSANRAKLKELRREMALERSTEKSFSWEEKRKKNRERRKRSQRRKEAEQKLRNQVEAQPSASWEDGY